MTEDEMLGWHHRLDGREFEQVVGVSDGQGSLVCCSPWDFPGKSTGVGYSGLISFMMDWLDLLAVQGTLKSLLQHQF